MKKIVVHLLIELVIAIIIINIDFKAFIVYALISIQATILLNVDFLRKLIRVTQFLNEGKLVVIERKLGIKEGDKYTKTVESEIYKDFTEEQLKQFDKDYADLTRI